MQEATFGAGCFWGVEATFSKLKGVVETKVGYMGGSLKNPTYEDVCTNTTGHAEVIHITYNPKEISYEDLLSTFWNMHDPTQFHRQGPDIGSQYRSVIFYYNEKQKHIAEESITNEQKKYKKKIVTELQPAKEFFPAEEYHQNYLEKQGLSSCRY